jgi:hypothetical protein
MQTVEPYAQRILDGSTVTHSGSNWIGILNDDAKNAEYWITSFLSDQDCDSGYVDEWSPADWIGEGNRDVHDYMTEEAIQTVMNTYFRNQHSDIGPVVFSSDPEKWIRQRMEEDRQSS